MPIWYTNPWKGHLKMCCSRSIVPQAGKPYTMIFCAEIPRSIPWWITQSLVPQGCIWSYPDFGHSKTFIHWHNLRDIDLIITNFMPNICAHLVTRKIYRTDVWHTWNNYLILSWTLLQCKNTQQLLYFVCKHYGKTLTLMRYISKPVKK